MRTTAHGVIRSSVEHAWALRSLNRVYRGLSPDRQERFHGHFAKLFRSVRAAAPPAAAWTVGFGRGRITVPLTADRLWLDWDLALSVIGHDVQTKLTYLDALMSADRPDLFVDVGANYGLHSLLFLVNGVPAISFEPNPECHTVFQELCLANGVSPRIEGVAIGDGPGSVTLHYPAGETWLGTTAAAVRDGWAETAGVTTRSVPMRTLDDYRDVFRGKRLLLKIDTEGNELNVLRGAAATLREHRPMIAFECWQGPQREGVSSILQALNYRLARLPWVSGRRERPLRFDEFVGSTDVDFIALPS